MDNHIVIGIAALVFIFGMLVCSTPAWRKRRDEYGNLRDVRVPIKEQVFSGIPLPVVIVAIICILYLLFGGE